VAIEKREAGEQKVEGPSIDELVQKETVDSLPYVGWQEEKKEAPVVPFKSRKECLENAKVAQAAQNSDGTGSPRRGESSNQLTIVSFLGWLVGGRVQS
jgi:hypothetical protein